VESIVCDVFVVRGIGNLTEDLVMKYYNGCVFVLLTAEPHI